MRNSLIVMALAAFVLPFSSCKKSDPTKAEILAAHNWQVKSATIDPAYPIVTPAGISTTNDYYTNIIPACQKDDFYTFLDTNDAIRNEGGSKCGGAQTIAATWALLSGETQLQYSEGGTVTLFSIKGITETSIVVTNTVTQLGITYTITTTWEKP